MSLNETSPRYRLNATQSANNVWSFNATGEDKDIHVRMSNDPEDLGTVAHEPIGLKVLTMIKEAEDIWRDDGRLVASDPNQVAISPPKSYSKQRKAEWYNVSLDKYSAVIEALTNNFTAEKLGHGIKNDKS